MKKFIFALAFLFVFAGITTAHASAAVVCDYPDHAIYSADGTVKEGCIADVTWKASLASQTNQGNKDDFVIVSQGQKIMTTYGSDTCASWFPMRCVIKKALFVNFI